MFDYFVGLAFKGLQSEWFRNFEEPIRYQEVMRLCKNPSET